MNGDGDSPATELLTGVALSGRREGKGGNEDAGRRASRGKGRQDERSSANEGIKGKSSIFDTLDLGMRGGHSSQPICMGPKLAGSAQTAFELSSPTMDQFKR